MSAISVDDYLDPNRNEIFAQDINNRIEHLKGQIREDQQEGRIPDEDAVAECDALIAFRDAVEVATGNHFDQATIVPEDEFENHARDWAHGIGDVEFLDPYVDWERFAADLRAERCYVAMDLGDDLVHVR
jgi:hypothetical protein